jgi:hypothetical protein
LDSYPDRDCCHSFYSSNAWNCISVNDDTNYSGNTDV